jgi:uncharacterized peroxidase-related enzyme
MRPYASWMGWIASVPPEQATGRLRDVYRRVAGPGGEVDNILTVHGLRPHTLQGHLALYKAVLHHSGNTLPVWLLETVGVYVSLLNRCAYCVDHHAVGLAREMADRAAVDAILSALRTAAATGADVTGDLGEVERRVLRYARLLTEDPSTVGPDDVAALRDAGLDDGQVLEVNQVVAYFAYANRTVLGLGVTTAGDVLGLSPPTSDDTDTWTHR